MQVLNMAGESRSLPVKKSLIPFMGVRDFFAGMDTNVADRWRKISGPASRNTSRIAVFNLTER